MIALGFLALVAGSVAAPATPAAKAGWTIDAGGNRCALARQGEAGLVLQLIPGTAEIELSVFDSRWSSAPVSRDADATVLLQPGNEEVTASEEPVKAADGRWSVRLRKLDRPFLDQFAAATSLAVRSKGHDVAQVPIPGAAKAVAALRACEASALKDWGQDAAAMMSLRSWAKPAGGAETWITDKDYPDDAIRGHESGTVVVLLKIGADGVATGCAVIDSSGSKTLDDQTCAIYGRRARYDPAIDATGKPIAGLAAVRIRWVLPEG
jgi:TonB family protein